MFGTYRTVLAIFVVAAHLMSITIIGQYAVHGFFILSGYLMTHIMHHSYAYTGGGMKKFAINRLLRLFPLYWLLVVLMAGMIIFAGADVASEFNRSMGIPNSVGGWLANLSMIYPKLIPMTWVPRISPPTWALTVELAFYLLICLGISRTRGLTFFWLAASMAYTAATHMLGIDWNHRYSSVLAGSLPFALGATLYHMRPSMLRHFHLASNPQGMSLLFCIYLVNLLGGCLVVLLGWSSMQGNFHFYLNLALSFMIVFSLSAKSASGTLRRIDTAIGDYSYPIYLLHYPLGMLVSYLAFDESVRGFTIQGFILFCITTPACIAVSYFAIRLIDKPIQRIRDNVKARVHPVQGSVPASSGG